VSACGSGDARRRAHADGDGGVTDDGGATPPPVPDGEAPPGSIKYFGSTGPAGGTVMTGGGYVLFSVTGEVPGTSGLSKNADHQMIGGVLGRAH